MRKRLTTLLGACISASLLAACGGGNGASSSTPMSVEPEIAAHQSGMTHSTLRRATSGANLYVANASNNTVTVYAPGSNSVLRTISQSVSQPGELAFDGSGNLYVANCPITCQSGGSTVTVYAAGKTKLLRTITQGLDGPVGLAFDASGNLYVANLYSKAVTVYAPGGTSVLRTITQGLINPNSLAFDSSGNLYVANLHGADVTVYAPGSGRCYERSPTA